VQVSWGLSSDFGKELGGWTLDDVCIKGLVKIPRCGDGEIDYGEECDDGNNTDGDGCAKDCSDEVEAGGGGCCDARNAAPGNGLLALALAGVLRACSRRRGRSIRR
jgi:cysteine-rich repeat protein